MDKPTVFISHIHEEKSLAIELKHLIEKSFEGKLNIFVSSDESCIPMGKQWLEEVIGSLKKCSIELILCSRISIHRPWINFEAGAGFIRGIKTIPLCHSGLDPSKLPIPLSLLQSAKISDEFDLSLVFTVLANEIGVASPCIDFSEFKLKVKEFESEYNFWDECNDNFMILNEIIPNELPKLIAGNPFEIELKDTDTFRLEKLMIEYFTPNRIFSIERIGTDFFSSSTIIIVYIQPLERLSIITKDSCFIYQAW